MCKYCGDDQRINHPLYFKRDDSSRFLLYPWRDHCFKGFRVETTEDFEFICKDSDRRKGWTNSGSRADHVSFGVMVPRDCANASVHHEHGTIQTALPVEKEESAADVNHTPSCPTPPTSHQPSTPSLSPCFVMTALSNKHVGNRGVKDFEDCRNIGLLSANGGRKKDRASTLTEMAATNSRSRQDALNSENYVASGVSVPLDDANASAHLVHETAATTRAARAVGRALDQAPTPTPAPAPQTAPAPHPSPAARVAAGVGEAPTAPPVAVGRTVA